MNLTVLRMKTAILFPVLMLALATSGCSWSHHDTGTSRPAAASPAPIITPDLSLAARVVSVNNVGRFVVLSFPATQMRSEERRVGKECRRGGLAGMSPV